MASYTVIFLVMSIFRIWFDLAQADVVLTIRGGAPVVGSLPAYLAASGTVAGKLRSV
jgi:hypothetical protein